MKEEMQQYIENKLKSMADEDYLKFQMKICPQAKNRLGVRMPDLHALAKEIYETYGLDYFRYLKSDYYEEIMLEGLIIGLLRIDLEQIFEYIRNFLPKIDNWAICDSFCASLRLARWKRNKEAFWNFILPYLQSKREYEVRFAIVMMVDHFVINAYVDYVLPLLDTVKHKGYYVIVAMGWLVAEVYAKCPYAAAYYMCNCHLDDYTYNMITQKITQSKKVIESDKIVVRLRKRI